MRGRGAYGTIRAMQSYFAYLGSGVALFVLELLVPRGFAGIGGTLLCLMASWSAAQRLEGASALGFSVLALAVAGGMFLLVSRFGSGRTSRGASAEEEKERDS